MSAADRFFVDTNVLLYAADAADRSKQEAARDWLSALWELGAGRLSWQVLHEFYVNAVRKRYASSVKARTTVESFSSWRPVEADLSVIRRAWRWMDNARLSHWDALILAAAERSGCIWLLTEDFQEGRKFGDLSVVNPFHTEPSALGLRVRD